jgi:hypothetical protein
MYAKDDGLMRAGFSNALDQAIFKTRRGRCVLEDIGQMLFLLLK